MIGEALRSQGRTNKWFAEQMGKSVNTISLWVTNKVTPSLDDIIKASRILGVPMADLINVNAEEDKEDEDNK